ncbi:hypothetical protein [Frankia sp. CiP3]|uniref:hypothetical protein n=1 Tax=Frankia sp. CiP3 TaxID=2880971 RepID=UPI001EF47439|nr:hypothetical protein [Frankia sp. CiP3]
MSRELPSEGPAREIFFTALRRLSDQCTPPDLTPECPFSIDLPAGGRGCGEECEELLQQHGSPSRAPGITLSPLGISAYRRSRPGKPKSRAHEDKAFDAGEIYYRDNGTLPVPQWRTVALLYEVAQIFSTPPHARTVLQSEARVVECVSELTRRGFNMPRLILDGLARRISAIILVDLMIGLVKRNESPGQADLHQVTAAWLAIIDASESKTEPPVTVRKVGDDKSDVGLAKELAILVSGDFFDGIARWCETLDWRRLLNWQAPSSGEFSKMLAAGPGSPTSIDIRAAEWMFDRFTNTYLRDWSAESLRLEWRYIRGSRIDPPFPIEQMDDRPVDRQSLANFVADLALTNKGRNQRVGRLTHAALNLLRSGHRSAASSLFSAYLESDWDDGEMHNHYGFCILPDRPEVALDAFERAARAGYRKSINLANRTLALYWLGRSARLLEMVDSAFEAEEIKHRRDAYLWSFVDGREQSKLVPLTCPWCYAAELAVRVAAESGDDLLKARWKLRTQELKNECAG